MGYITGLKCIKCGEKTTHKELVFGCPRCGGLLDAEYDYDALAELDFEEIKRRRPSLWKWKEFMPIEDESKIVSLGEGGTPLLRCDKIASEVGVRELYVKDDAMTQPTGSLKDRSTPVAATKALEFGCKVLTCASTGNKAASVAAYAARAGLKSVVFCPSNTPRGKLAQALAYGAIVVRINTDFMGVAEIKNKLVHDKKLDWYMCDLEDPFRYEGKKTYAYEQWEDFNWESVADRIVHPAAGSMSIIKMWKGFKELHELDLIKGDLPKMTAVQAEACAPIVKAFREGKKRVEPVPLRKTIAEAIKVTYPGDAGDWTLEAIRESKGNAVGVTDDEIIHGMKLLCKEGIFIEPSGAAPIAGVKKLVNMGEIDKDERVVCNLTGVGFKDVESYLRIVEIPKAVEAKVEDVERALSLAGVI